MCGGQSTSTQSTTIPPEVLARYNAVNARAEDVAKQPFQQYKGEFVAPLNSQQMAGFKNINDASGLAQGVFNTSQQMLSGAYGQGAQGVQGATNVAGTGYAEATPYYGQGQDIASAAYGQGLGQMQNIYGGVSGLSGAASPYLTQGLGAAQAAANQAAPQYQTALALAGQGLGQGAGLTGQAQGFLNNAVSQGQLYANMALPSISGALSSAQPYMQSAAQLTGRGLTAAEPLMGAAEQFLGGGTQAVNPQEFGQAQINKYMSPYMKNVVEAQQALQQQEAAAQRSALNSQAIGAGAFGGDRAGIAQANLARQQSLANQATLGNLLQQGYGQAAGMFQQQQGVDLAAQQANRAAQQFGAQQAAALGQQRFGQQLTTGQQMAGLGQQQFQQQLGQGQAVAGLGQQLYGQGLGAAGQAAGLGQNLYGMNLGAAQNAQSVAQGMYGMGSNLGAMQQQTGQNLFNMNAQQAQMQQAAAQNMYQMGQQAGQFRQQTGQQMLGAAQSQAGLENALAQSLYGMGSQTAQTGAGLGAQQQAALLQGAQAQVGAGTLGQQTQQAQDTAQYQQFLQERGYPFQVAQFLANIAMGTGALSGSTTTTTQPNSLFSDRRLKKDIKEIGETHDGLPIYSFKYKGGDDQQRIGVMADEAREKHPDAVSRVNGVDAVDYEKIANRASEGGGVMPSRAGEGFAEGGHVSAEDLAAIIAMQKQFLGPHGQGGLYGQSAQNLPGGKGIVPQASLPVSRLSRHPAPPQQQSGMRQAMSELGQANQLGEALLGDKGLVGRGRQAYAALTGPKQTPPKPSDTQAGTSQSVPQPMGVKPAAKPPEAQADAGGGDQSEWEKTPTSGGVMPQTADAITPPDEDILSPSMFANRGGVVPHKATGGHLQEKILPYQSEDPYGIEAVNEAESGEKYDLLGDEKGGGLGAKKGKSGASMALKGASALANLIPGVGPFVSAGLGAASAFVKDGGRIRPGYQQAGVVTPEASSEKEYSMDDYLNALSKIESSHNYGARGPITKSGDRAYGRYQVMGANVPSWTQEHYGQSLSPEEFRANKEAQEAVARGQFGKYLNQYGSPEDAASMWFSGRPMAKAGNSADVTGTTVPAYISKFRSALGLGAPEVDAGGGDGSEPSTPEQRQTQEQPSGLMPTNFRTGKPFTSAGDFLTDRQFLIPLLSGVGAMASSPSRYFGGALLQGVGAAAQSYGGMEKQQQEIAESKAREMDYLTNAANNAIFERGGVTYVRLANGQEVTLDRWIENQEPLTGGAAVAQAAIDVYRRKTGQEPPATNASGAVNPNVAAKPSAGVTIPLPQFVSYDDSVTQRAKSDLQSGSVKGGQEYTLEAAKQRAKINNGADAARSVAPIVNEMSRNVADSLALTGLATSGPGFNNIATAAGLLNSWAQRFGFNVDFGNAADIKAKSDKYAAMLSAMAAQGVGQETLGAMQRLYDAMPNPEMPRAAQAQLAAELLVFNKKDQHRQNFTQRYNKDSMNTPMAAASEFERMNGQKYLDAVSIVKNIMVEDPKLFGGLMRGEIPPKQLEDLIRRYAETRGLKYAPGMSDFFVGR